MTRRTIRIPKPRDPLQAEIDRRIALKKLTSSMPPMGVTQRLAQAQASAAVNQLREDMGYHRRPSALDIKPVTRLI